MSDFDKLRGPSSIDWHGRGYGTANYGSDHLKNIIFYVHSTHNPHKSEEAGRPMYDPVDHIKMFDPAEPMTVIDRPVRDDDKRRFQRQWSQFLDKKEQVPEGTPIDHLFPNNPAMAANLRSYGVYTIEQCANMSLHAVQNINMGAQEAQNRAKAYLEQASQGTHFHKLVRENEDLKEKLTLLTRNHATLQTQFNAFMEKLADPNKNSNSPGWQQGYDAQAERLNTNHPSYEVAEKRKKSKKVVYEQPVEVSEEQNQETKF